MDKKLLEQQYKNLFLKPEDCEPLVSIAVGTPAKYSWTEMIHDKKKMLDQQVCNARMHERIGDDTLSSLRVNFGTAQIAASFGCKLRDMITNLPACESHILANPEMVKNLKMPTMQDGWNERLLEFEEYFMENKPSDLPVQHPDVQSTFNSAHLIRGNDILYDFYDEPELLSELLKKVTDFMIYWIRETKALITKDTEWFYDACGIWKGGARISNCTMQIISPQLYKDFIYEEDMRFLKAVNGGRIHYCGSHEEVISEFFKNKQAHSFEFDGELHDPVKICGYAPKEAVIKFCDWNNDSQEAKWITRIKEGRIPEKKNIVISARAKDEEEAKKTYDTLKNNLCR